MRLRLHARAASVLVAPIDTITFAHVQAFTAFAQSIEKRHGGIHAITSYSLLGT